MRQLWEMVGQTCPVGTVVVPIYNSWWRRQQELGLRQIIPPHPRIPSIHKNDWSNSSDSLASLKERGGFAMMLNATEYRAILFPVISWLTVSGFVSALKGFSALKH